MPYPAGTRGGPAGTGMRCMQPAPRGRAQLLLNALRNGTDRDCQTCLDVLSMCQGAGRRLCRRQALNHGRPLPCRSPACSAHPPLTKTTLPPPRCRCRYCRHCCFCRRRCYWCRCSCCCCRRRCCCCCRYCRRRRRRWATCCCISRRNYRPLLLPLRCPQAQCAFACPIF